MEEPIVEPTRVLEPAVVVEQTEEGKAQLASKNGKKPEGAGGSSFFTWFMVLALLGVWTSVAVVYFDLVDYQGVIGKLSSYDADGDGDFDVEDAKVLLEHPLTKDVGWKLREALKQQLAIIHERVEAKKIAKMALAEVRNILAREEEEKVLGVTRDESAKKAKVAVAARMKEEEEKIEKEEFEKALEKIRRDKEQEEEKGKKHKKEKKPEKKSGKEAEAVGQKAEAPKEAKSKEAPKASAKKLKVSDKGVRK
ncbi:vicilin-like seed storage protein At2g18540 isoform X10 [Coregonus clupeaformis]|uniref:vicilin-like seed storage protein At2g18540 isoform X10 n=1 Tax=Coregonus clupeaformis TaxID=59861 RepID=UPI001E1C8D8D|nr:vicilin-like seed storage protein At2g18540 isoform X10 [Coregonus clupeaformis]